MVTGFFQKAAVKGRNKHPGKDGKNIKPDHAFLQPFQQSDHHDPFLEIDLPDHIPDRR
jgi:hypothetical protein